MAVRDSIYPSPSYRPVRRVAMIVVHSNPLIEPGWGDAGGMTVYVREAARALTAEGVAIDVYTRRDPGCAPGTVELYPGVNVIQVRAGDPDLPKEELPERLPEFRCAVAAAAGGRPAYDAVHSHYWLSGAVALRLAREWGVPFIHTFHTLGHVKNGVLRSGDGPEPPRRLCGEARVVEEAAAIVASSAEEKRSLIDLYGADPDRVRVIPPGVDHDIFRPSDRTAAKRRLGLERMQVLLFAGRLQPLKAPDIAVRAFHHLISWGRLDPGKAKLLIVGGASGPAGSLELDRVRSLVAELGLAEHVVTVPALPHREMPAVYAAADVCLVPSQTESFGLVALEAQACGVPVVGSNVGGLKEVVNHGQTGFLVEPSSPEAFAEGVWRILSGPLLARSLSRIARCSSEAFSWTASARALLDLYRSAESIEANVDDDDQDANKVLRPRRNLVIRH